MSVWSISEKDARLGVLTVTEKTDEVKLIPATDIITAMVPSLGQLLPVALTPFMGVPSGHQTTYMICFGPLRSLHFPLPPRSNTRGEGEGEGVNWACS